MTRLLDHFYLFFAIILAVYSQCVIRWRLGLANQIPEPLQEKIKFVALFLLEPWVISSILATFIAGVFWIVALSKFELNYAYPWMALIFVIMTFAGTLLFGESLSTGKLIGTTLVSVGLVLVARS